MLGPDGGLIWPDGKIRKRRGCGVAAGWARISWDKADFAVEQAVPVAASARRSRSRTGVPSSKHLRLDPEMRAHLLEVLGELGLSG